MGGFIRRNDPWAIGAFILWIVILVMGLLPNETFWFLRRISGVLTQNALLNSPLDIWIGFSAYVAFFTWRRCHESTVLPERAKANALQVGFFACAAFCPIQPKDIQWALQIPDDNLRAYLLTVIGSLTVLKLGAWLYLLSLLFRYYMLHNYSVFSNIPSVFPSIRRAKREHYEKNESLYDPTGD